MTPGPNSRIEQVLGEYGLGANSWAMDILQSDTDRLLLALLLEQRGQDLIEALDAAGEEYEETTATYATGEVTSGEEWSEPIEFGFVSSSIDLRINDSDIEVAFADPEHNEGVGVPYKTDNSPVVGIPAETTKMWVRRAPSEGSGGTVQFEAWS
ncbi:hypothetical protein [Haloarchaeobius salinus]|uniref:hypothetical protein n=1 Tax=Haloarchaeobius salinus TaxID=1198298 RepID=UPI00210C7494|nr:hypothetical protein [Haloarchaeobius salinus]